MAELAVGFLLLQKNTTNMIEQPVTKEPGLADDLLQYSHEPASTGQRFGNFIIDALVMYFGMNYISGIIIGFVLSILAPDFLDRAINYQEQGPLLVLLYLAGIISNVFYYTLSEKLFRGYTLGKLLTGTRAIRTDGGELTWRDSFLRSLSRLVPFEPFSAFDGSPWHDRWTKTYVIKTRR
jgi:uncharacterized RDD family membrane protein YckC